MEQDICALHSAIGANDYEEVASLIEAGVDVNVKNEYHTPLIIAIYNGRDSIVELLLKRGADVELTSPFCSLYPIHIAAEEGNLNIVKLLVEYGACVNRRMSSGACAIHVAANEGHIHIIDYLLENGVDIDVFNPEGIRLHWTAKYNKSVVKHIFEKGANINERDYTDKTILHIYACRGFLDMIEFLIDNGAQAEVYDADHRTPLNLLLKYHSGDSYIPSAKVLMKYMLLQSKKPEFSFSDYSIPNDYRHLQELTAFFNDCKREVEQMKSFTFGNSTLSLHTFLQDIFDEDKLLTYLNNEEIREGLENMENRINDFSIYSSMSTTVKIKIERCKERLDLLRKAFQHLDAKLIPILPYEIKQKIFGYLSNENLINFVDALTLMPHGITNK